MDEHFNHIFIEQVYQNDKLIQRFMYAKDGTLIHDFLDDEESKNKLLKEQVYYFANQFFNEKFNQVNQYNNTFFDNLLMSAEEVYYDDKGNIDAFKSLLYDLIYVENDNIGFPVRIYDKNKNFFQEYKYDENYNLKYVNDNDIDIYKFQYVFYEDIYDILKEKKGFI